MTVKLRYGQGPDDYFEWTDLTISEADIKKQVPPATGALRHGKRAIKLVDGVYPLEDDKEYTVILQTAPPPSLSAQAQLLSGQSLPASPLQIQFTIPEVRFSPGLLHPEKDENNQLIFSKLFPEVWNNPFPLSTPQIGLKSNPGTNFLFGSFSVGDSDAQLSAITKLTPTDSVSVKKVYFMRGVSGSGKTRVPMVLALRGEVFVFILNCGKKGMLSVPDALRRFQKESGPWRTGFAVGNTPKNDIWEMYWDLESKVRHYLLRVALAHLLFLRSALLQHNGLTPIELCRMLDDGATSDVLHLVDILHSYTYQELCSTVSGLVVQITTDSGRGVFFAFDEVQDLLDVLDGCIPFGTQVEQQNGDPSSVSTLDECGRLQKGTCALGALVHVALDIAQVPSIFFGTALRLEIVMERTSAFRKQNAVCIDAIAPLKSWKAADVTTFLDHYLKLHADQIQKIAPVLVGRARITVLFLNNIFNLVMSGQRDIDGLIDRALNGTVQEIYTIMKEEYTSMELSTVINGRPVSKAEIFRKIVLLGERIHFSRTQKDLISRTMLFLNEDGQVEEPLVVHAIKKLLDDKGISVLGITGDKGQDMANSEGKTSSSKGAWSELAFAHILMDAAKTLNGRAITDHPLFAALKGTIFDGYGLRIQTLCFGPDHWKKCLQKSDMSCIFLQLDILLRWDLLALLAPLKGGLPPALLVTGAKLLEKISTADFCDNALSSIPILGYTKNGDIMNYEKRLQLEQLLMLYSGSPSLSISFIYGGFPEGVERQHAWNSGNNFFLVIDRDSPGLQELLPIPLRDSFDAFVGEKKQSSSPSDVNPSSLVHTAFNKCIQKLEALTHVEKKILQFHLLSEEDWAAVRRLPKKKLQQILKQINPKIATSAWNKDRFVTHFRSLHWKPE